MIPVFVKFKALIMCQGMGNATDSELIMTLRNAVYTDKLLKGGNFVNDVIVKDFFDYTFLPEDMFEKCSYVTPKNYTVVTKPCRDIFNITPYFKEAYKCFAFSLKDNTNYDYLTMQRIKGTNGYMYNILLLPNVTTITDDLFIFYHPRGTFPRSGFTRSISATDIKSLFSLTFQTFTVERLAAPYDTDCRNYTLDYGNKGACFESCVQLQSLQRFGKISAGTNVFKGLATDKEQLMSIAAINADADLFRVLRNIENECDRACDQPNCYESYYTPTVMSTSDYNQSSLTTYVDQYPSIITECDAKIDFISFATDVTSTLGFCE